MESQGLANIYLIEIKTVRLFRSNVASEKNILKKHIKNRRWLQYLVENKCRKNVGFGA